MIDYFKSCELPSWERIVSRYEHMISNAGELHAIELPQKEYAWIYPQLGNTINDVVGTPARIIRGALMFFQVGNHTRGIHVDGWRTSRVDEKWALNIPIKNCQSSRMVWYDGDYEKTVVLNPIGLPSLHLNWNSEPQEVASCVIDKPTFVRTNVPHTVINYSPQPRCLLSLRFTPELFE